MSTLGKTPLIGRDAELDAVLRELDAGARLVTLLGPPGIGKTRLATAARERVAGRFSTRFCDLSSAATEQALCLAVASALDERSPSSLGLGVIADSVDAVSALLASQGPQLVVLDNFEQLSSCAAVIHHWLSQHRDLVFVVTSRERLAIDGEHVIELAPLSLPPPGAGQREQRASAAVQLFLTRAHQAGAPASDDLDSVVEIVRRLDGIPLAIELAAARTRLLPAAELARRLGRGEDVLGSARTGSGRYRTLSAAIAWSWSLLEPEEQLALAVCSVFRQSFDLEAAEALIGQAGVSAPLDRIAALRDKSLLSLDEAGRLALYQSIAEFADKRLEELGKRRTARLAHARYYARLAEELIAARLLRAAEPDPRAMGRVRLERDNLVAAFEHATSLDGEPTLRATLASALALLHLVPADQADKNLVAVLAEPLTTNQRAQALLARQSSLAALGRFDEALALAHQVIDTEDVDPGLRCFAYVYAGIQLRSDGDTERALGYHQRAEALLSSHDLPRLSAMNTACMGRLECDRSNLDAARELNRRATQLCDAMGDLWLSALGIANLAQLEQEMRSFVTADDLFERALRRLSDANEVHYEGIYATRRAGLYLEWKRPDAARESLVRAKRLLSRVNLPIQVAVVHAIAALAEAEAGDPDAARAELELSARHSQRGATGVLGQMLELLTHAVELRDPRIHAATVERRRQEYADLTTQDDARSRSVRRNLDTRFALRMLERALAAHAAAPRILVVGRAGAWFSLDGAARVDLRRRGSLRRMLDALVSAHAARPSPSLGGAALLGAGWPDERILAEAAATRVRVAVATLRKLGLRDVLLTHDDGYRLDPDLRVERG